MSDLRYGITRQAHVEGLVESVETAINAAALSLRSGKRLRSTEREALSRELAGVIARCETLRIWLAAGAPQ